VSGLYFDWSSDQGVDIVIVKGGDNASVYRADEARSGVALRAPINPENGQPYGLSHITYCYDPDPAAPAPCPAGTTAMPGRDLSGARAARADLPRGHDPDGRRHLQDQRAARARPVHARRRDGHARR
jgi:hypothetical protein